MKVFVVMDEALGCCAAVCATHEAALRFVKECDDDVREDLEILEEEVRE